ncbi:hypothetical protein PsorP6_018222 [Peronosclerospora sorghi]|uniref:Uncharacterized protein n=1 Tax=Peronosclerospora sorghi TaxID=230839 RepID=A0ACC0WEL9_9STRA|nr:hypothetical protein PsorP6_018222 [Peronosclerospora sorghi]
MQVLTVTTALLSPSLLCRVSSSDVLRQQLWGLPSGIAYYVKVKIGTYSSSTGSSSATAFNLLLDTGSANTAVVTPECCSLTNRNLFSCTDSSTCMDTGITVHVTYVSGAWGGEIVYDTFAGKGLGSVERMPFAEITAEENFLSPGYDGIIGLGYRAIAYPPTDPPTPYFDNVQSVKGLNNLFSLQMCGALQSLSFQNVSMTDDSYLYAGEFLLGGVTGQNGETYHKGEIIYTPLVQDKYFNVVVTNVGVNGKRVELECKTINSPRAIIDSGTSNLAFPPTVFSAIVAELKAEVEKVTALDVSDSFFRDDGVCCSEECDPTNTNSIIYTLPVLTISLALDNDKSQQMTISIPPEYIWRPIVVSTDESPVACRVFGISEGDFTLLGDVFMDGLFIVHDRENQRVGIAIADNCPNSVRSNKSITLETVSNEDSMCDCVGGIDRKSSLLSSYLPFSHKPCFFWMWWMYVILVAFVMIILMAIAYGYFWWKRRKLLQELETLQRHHQLTEQQRLEANVPFDSSSTRQSSVSYVDASTPSTTSRT